MIAIKPVAKAVTQSLGVHSLERVHHGRVLPTPLRACLYSFQSITQSWANPEQLTSSSVDEYYQPEIPFLSGGKTFKPR